MLKIEELCLEADPEEAGGTQKLASQVLRALGAGLNDLRAFFSDLPK
jgi:hypothetical protein